MEDEEDGEEEDLEDADDLLLSDIESDLGMSSGMISSNDFNQ